MLVELQDFHFLRPWWLLALLIPLLWGWQAYKKEHLQSSWADVCDEHLLNFLLIKGNDSQRRFSYLVAVFFMIFAVLALAGPTWVKKPNPALSVDNPLMIALSLSSEMEAKDVAPNRLVRARYIIKDFIRTLHSTEIGLEVYSDEPFVISPLTEDTALIDNLLPVIERDIVPADGDRLDRAIEMAVARMRNAEYVSGNIIVVAANVGEYFDAALSAAENAHNKGFDVNVIKVSAEANEKLQMVAQKGGGIYLNYNQNYDALSKKINGLSAKELNESKNMQSSWVDLGYYLFWLPALLLLYYYRRGVVAGLLLCLLSSQAYAGFFLNDNQEAMQYYKRHQFDKAAQTFKDARWRGAAAYKNGDYLRAYQEFSRQDDTESLYNQGNALAKSGKIDEAIAKYEEVLKRDPEFADAKFNLEYLKNMKKNQNQEQNQKQDNQKDSQNNDNSGGSDKDKNNQQQDPQQQGNEQQESGQQENKQQENKQQEQKGDSQNRQEQQSDSRQQQSNNNDSAQEQSAQQQKQNTDNAQQSQVQSAMNNKQDKSSNAQSAENNKNEHSEGQQGAENENSAAGDNTSAQNSEKSDTGDKEQETQTRVQSGQPDENGEEAESVPIQNGDKSDDDKNKIRARIQKFREIPEDRGGLLRSLIAKEYSKNRYNDE